VNGLVKVSFHFILVCPFTSLDRPTLDWPTNLSPQYILGEVNLAALKSFRKKDCRILLLGTMRKQLTTFLVHPRRKKSIPLGETLPALGDHCPGESCTY